MSDVLNRKRGAVHGRILAEAMGSSLVGGARVYDRHSCRSLRRVAKDPLWIVAAARETSDQVVELLPAVPAL